MVLGVLGSARADMTWLYAVQISATTQTNPAQITLHWEPDQYGADSYVVCRKLKTDSNWGPEQTLSGSATNFSDSDVSVGSAYEYQIIKHATLGYTGYGYICAGINAPLIENRGKIILIVAADTISLVDELARLKTDLTADGWLVLRHDVSPGAVAERREQGIEPLILDSGSHLCTQAFA